LKGIFPSMIDVLKPLWMIFMKTIDNLHNFLKFRCYDRDSSQKEHKMKKAWKWILGLVLVFVVVAALVAVPFVIRSTMAANFNRTAQQTAPGANLQSPGWQRGPMMRGNDDGQGQQGQNSGRFDGRGGPMMGGGRGFERGFSHFGGFGPFGLMFIGGLLRLIPLALFGLLLYGVYQLGKRAGVRSTLIPAPVSTQPAPPAAESEEKPAAE
jgi:hypothetical protein